MTAFTKRTVAVAAASALTLGLALAPQPAAAQDDPCPEDPRCALVGPPPQDCTTIFRPTWIVKNLAWCYVQIDPS